MFDHTKWSELHSYLDQDRCVAQTFLNTSLAHQNALSTIIEGATVVADG
jgi:hypothetical protein